jgi:mannitol-1-/sugar-/sorbitol-6-phosphatase
MSDHSVARGLRARAVLLDMDGVLLDTSAFFASIWTDWARERFLDPATVLPKASGHRTADVLRDVAPHLDLNAETELLDSMVLERIHRVQPVPGAAALLARLDRDEVPWAVVSSGSRWFATECFRQAKLPFPRVALFAEDVKNGKPAPEGYLAAARLLGMPPSQCVVLEDAPPGIAAARAAGCLVIALATTSPPDLLKDASCCLLSLVAAADLPESVVRGPATHNRSLSHGE